MDDKIKAHHIAAQSAKQLESWASVKKKLKNNNLQAHASSAKVVYKNEYAAEVEARDEL